MKLRTKERRDYRQPYYRTVTWRRIRKTQLRKSPLCEMCLKKIPKKLEVSTICDHIDPTWETWDDFIRGPFQSLCLECDKFKRSIIDYPLMRKKERTKMEVIDL